MKMLKNLVILALFLSGFSFSNAQNKLNCETINEIKQHKDNQWQSLKGELTYEDKDGIDPYKTYASTILIKDWTGNVGEGSSMQGDDFKRAELVYKFESSSKKVDKLYQELLETLAECLGKDYQKVVGENKDENKTEIFFYHRHEQFKNSFFQAGRRFMAVEVYRYYPGNEKGYLELVFR